MPEEGSSRKSKSDKHSRPRSRSPPRHHLSKRDRSRSRDRDDKKRRDKDRRKEENTTRRSDDHDDADRKKRKREKLERDADLKIVDDDKDGVQMEWDQAQRINDDTDPVANVPTAESYKLTSHASAHTSAPSPPHRSTVTLIPIGSPSDPTLDAFNKQPAKRSNDSPSHDDFFSNLGTEVRGANARKAKQEQKKADTEKTSYKAERLGYDPTAPAEDPRSASPPLPPPRIVPGAPGSSWRMIKLARTYEVATEEGRPLEEVALERYGTRSAWEEALEERRVLDSRSAGDSGRSTPRNAQDGKKGIMFTNDSSRPGSRAGFRRPPSDYANPSPRGGTPGPTASSISRPDFLKRQHSGTPIPSVFTPPITRTPQAGDKGKSKANAGQDEVPTMAQLNKLQASVLRAQLTNSDNVSALRAKYAAAMKKVEEAGGPAQDDVNVAGGERVEIVPTLDGRGRLYDVGNGNHSPDQSKLGPGNRKPQESKVETRDKKTGELLRINADDDSTTLGDLVRNERFGAGARDQKDADAEMAKRIMTDGKFENDLEYLDDNAERLARKKVKSDSSKRLFAINDFARTKKALAECPFCPSDEGKPPRAAVVASGNSAYLACTQVEELTNGHCLIVPMHHHLSTLEADDDVWDEIKNFMKCLMKMFAEQDQGVLFFETVLNLKQQKHTFIEVIPVPWDLFNDAPAYFREAIVAAESEWSQNKKLIDFSKRPGGFRRSLVSTLPYFMIQWDYKGEQGFGHVIEGMGENAGHAGEGENGEQDSAAILDEENKGGEIKKWFAHEIVGNLLDLEPRKWRRPKRMDQWRNPERVKSFLKMYQKFDWTALLSQDT